jgi:hypothetical protein
MLYLFNELLDTKGPTKNIIDENLKMDYGRISRLFRDEENRKQLMEIAREGWIVNDINPKFSLHELTESRSFISLLFYFGLLTVEPLEDGDFRLKIPNYSIKMVYWEYIQHMLEDDNHDVLVNLSHLRIAIKELAKNGNPDLLLTYISQNIIRILSNRDLEQFDEKYLKIILLTQLSHACFFIPISEMEVSDGYTDIYLMDSRVFRNIPHEWVWEIKYVRQQDANKPAIIEAKKQQLREQLAGYRASHLFAGRTDVRYLSVIFIGKKRVETEER